MPPRPPPPRPRRTPPPLPPRPTTTRISGEALGELLQKMGEAPEVPQRLTLGIPVDFDDAEDARPEPAPEASGDRPSHVRRSRAEWAAPEGLAHGPTPAPRRAAWVPLALLGLLVTLAGTALVLALPSQPRPPQPTAQAAP